MKKTKPHKTSILVQTLLHLLFLCIMFFPSQAQTNKTTNKIRILSVFNERGWELPWTTAKSKTTNKSKVEICNQEVTSKQVITPKEITTKIDTYLWSEDRRLLITPYICTIKNILSYEFEGKLFAYKVDLNPLSIEETTKNYLAGTFTIYYYDDDGDGTFETIEFNRLSPRRADWMKQHLNSAEIEGITPTCD